MLRPGRAASVALLLGIASVACVRSTPRGPVERVDPAAAPTPEPTALVRRPYAPTRGGVPIVDGISYGPFREGQRPGGPVPSEQEILQDLQILAPAWGVVRVYSSAPPTPAILQVIRANDLDIQVVVGAWIAPDDDVSNAREVAEAIRLARAYPDQVAAISVGNESQVDWSAHRSSREGLIGHLRAVRGAVRQPVTTADDYNFWNKPEAQEVAREVDFLLLHAYAMWNGKQLDEAVAWTASTVEAIRELHPDLPIVIGETGWATELNPEGSEREHIRAPAGEAEQARFFREFRAWARRARQPYFYFEAFDEPWKGSPDPREVEKHWGLYRVDRTPKAAIAAESP